MAEYLKGMGDLTATFKALNTDIRTKSARRIAASGAAELRKEAKAIVKAKGLIQSRALLNNIAIKWEKDAPVGTAQYNLGVRHGRDLGNGKKVIKFLSMNKAGRVVVKRLNDPFYWRFLEFGHKIVRRNVEGNQPLAITQRRRIAAGFVPATPFIGPALANKKMQAIAAMEAMALKLLRKQ